MWTLDLRHEQQGAVQATRTRCPRAMADGIMDALNHSFLRLGFGSRIPACGVSNVVLIETPRSLSARPNYLRCESVAGRREGWRGHRFREGEEWSFGGRQHLPGRAESVGVVPSSRTATLSGTEVAEGHFGSTVGNFRELETLRRGVAKWALAKHWLFVHEGVSLQDGQHRLRHLTELGGRIPRLADYHVSGDGTLCLGSRLSLMVRVQANPTIKGFVSGCLVPYLYAMTLKLDHGIDFVFGELRHGVTGEVDDYLDLLELKDRTQVIHALECILKKKRIANKLACPCRCGKRLGKCGYNSKIRELRGIFPGSWLRAYLYGK